MRDNMSAALVEALRKDFPMLAFLPPVGVYARDHCGECKAPGEWDSGTLSGTSFFRCHDCRRVWVEV